MLEDSNEEVLIFLSSVSRTLSSLSPPGLQWNAYLIGEGPILSPSLAETVVLSFYILPMLLPGYPSWSPSPADVPVVTFCMDPGSPVASCAAAAPVYMRLFAGAVSKEVLKFSYDSSGRYEGWIGLLSIAEMKRILGSMVL